MEYFSEAGRQQSACTKPSMRVDQNSLVERHLQGSSPTARPLQG